LWAIVERKLLCDSWKRDNMKNMIVIWAGAIVDIPAGWHLCDGTEGTPDLRNKFVIGAGSTYAPGATGGAATHTHTFTSAGHTHGIGGGPPNYFGSGAGNVIAATVSGTTAAGSNLPPYYALAYIMKL
jgi:hypothetical protein